MAALPPRPANGTTNRPVRHRRLDTTAPPRPLYGPWGLASPSEQPPGPRSATTSTYSAAGQRGWNSPDLRRTPNPRAADSVRSGKVDDPTPHDERFRRSETCTGGAGGTRTHGRRIMSPLRILAVLAIHVDSWRSCRSGGCIPVGLARSLSVGSGPCGPYVVPAVSQSSLPVFSLGRKVWRAQRPSITVPPTNSDTGS